MPRFSGFALMLFAATATMAAPPTEAEILQWIRDLEDPKFKMRTIASAKLKDAGILAIPHLVKPASVGSPETTDRVMKLLEEFAQSKDRLVEESATKVVRKLASGDGPGANSARQILLKRRHDFIQTMEEGGAVIYRTDEFVRYVIFDKVSAKEMPRFMRMLAEFSEVESFSARTSAFDDACAAELAKHLSNLVDANLFESSMTNEGLKSIAHLSKLKNLPMGKTKITDAGLKHLAGLKELNYIGMRGTAITDLGVRELKCHTNLTGINLGETKITDSVLSELKELPNLRSVYLDGTKITDKALEQLSMFKDLEEAWLLKTNTTFEGRNKLKERLPNLRIADEEKDYP